MNWKAKEKVSHGGKSKYPKRPVESPSYSRLVVGQSTGIHFGRVPPPAWRWEGIPGRGENPLRESQLPMVTYEVWSSPDSPPTLGGTAQCTSQMVSTLSCGVGAKHNSSESTA